MAEEETIIAGIIIITMGITMGEMVEVVVEEVTWVVSRARIGGRTSHQYRIIISSSIHNNNNNIINRNNTSRMEGQEEEDVTMDRGWIVVVLGVSIGGNNSNNSHNHNKR